MSNATYNGIFQVELARQKFQVHVMYNADETVTISDYAGQRETVATKLFLRWKPVYLRPTWDGPSVNQVR